MADILWAMKTLRLLECDYPFKQLFPAYAEWYSKVSRRRSFREGVMSKHKLMSSAFRAKASVEQVLGMGLKREVLRRVA